MVLLLCYGLQTPPWSRALYLTVLLMMLVLWEILFHYAFSGNVAVALILLILVCWCKLWGSNTTIVSLGLTTVSALLQLFLTWLILFAEVDSGFNFVIGSLWSPALLTGPCNSFSCCRFWLLWLHFVYQTA